VRTTAPIAGAAVDRESGSADTQPFELMPKEEQRRVLSSSRLHVALTTFVASLVLALAVLTTLLISHIFGQLNPTIRQDLAWKAERAAMDIAGSGELGILLGDAAIVRKTFERYGVDSDVTAIIATDMAGTVIAKQGDTPLSMAALTAGPPNQLGVAEGAFHAWAAAVVEGKPVGRVAVVVSTERLAAGERLKKRIMLTLGTGCVLGILLSLSFVRFYIVPLLRLTQRAFDRLRETTLAMVAKQRLERELEIGARIQTCILPKRILVPGLDVASQMRPATEVGGDYYDIVPASDGCWIGIGDVAGHGLTSGLVMLMAQSAIYALVNSVGTLSPREILCDANRLLYENIRHRLGQDQFVTLSLLRYFRDGRVSFAGAHEDMIVYRADSGKCEVIETEGAWLGVKADIAEQTRDRTLQLRDRDVIVLYTDGITEAMDKGGKQLGLPRLVEIVERNGELPVGELLDSIIREVDAWMDIQSDDVTALVVRYQAVPLPEPYITSQSPLAGA
jgi:urease gamma subunit